MRNQRDSGRFVEPKTKHRPGSIADLSGQEDGNYNTSALLGDRKQAIKALQKYVRENKE